jgi:hypothetical protein
MFSFFFVGSLQCADFGELIERNKDTTPQSAGYTAASRIWTGIEIVAQLDMCGINAERFSVLQVNSKRSLFWFIDNLLSAYLLTCDPVIHI